MIRLGKKKETGTDSAAERKRKLPDKDQIVIFALILVFCALIGGIFAWGQTAQCFSLETERGEVVYLAYNCGFSDLFHSKYQFSLHDDAITITNKGRTVVEGDLYAEAALQETERLWEQIDVRKVGSYSAKKLTLDVYEDEGVYYCFGDFKKTDVVGFFTYTTRNVSEKEAVALFRRFQGKRPLLKLAVKRFFREDD